MTDDHGDDMEEVKNYLGKLYASAKESSWAVILLDKSQAVVTAATMMLVTSFLWCTALTGMWGWGINKDISIGFTMFCGSFAWSSIRLCHILPGQPLDCPPDFRWTQCISWYDPSFPNSTSVITAMQVTTFAGLVNAVVITALALHTLIQVTDQHQFYKRMITGIIGSLANAALALATFVLFEYFPYANQVFANEGCVLLWVNDTIECVPVSTFDHPIRRAFAHTATVGNFVTSLMSVAAFAMGARGELYDPDKED